MDDNIIDYGSVTVPKSWNDITLKKFQEIERYMEESKEDKFDLINLIHILIDKPKDWVMGLPQEFLEEILEIASFISTQPEIKEPTNKIVIDGETYTVNVMNKLKVGEWNAFDQVIKNDKHNYAMMLAILCRKDDEIYNTKFEAEVLEERVKLFEKQPILEILRIINFFLTCYLTLRTHSRLYTEAEEAINLIAKQLETSHKIGVFKKQYLKWRIKNLRKLLESTKNTSQTSSHSLHTLYRRTKRKAKKTNFKKI